MIAIASSWTIEDGWARPLGTPKPNVPPRTQAQPSLRGTPPLVMPRVSHDARRAQINEARRRRVAAGGRW
jgi:hypothetical protein